MATKTLTADSLHAIRPALAEQCGVEPKTICSITIEIREIKQAKQFDWDKIGKMLDEIAALPVLDRRADEEIVGYDEFGVPR